MGLVATQWQSANYFFLVRVRDPFWTSILSFDLIKEWLLNNVSMINNSCKIEKCDNQRQSYRVMTIKKERRNQINKKNNYHMSPYKLCSVVRLSDTTVRGEEEMAGPSPHWFWQFAPRMIFQEESGMTLHGPPGTKWWKFMFKLCTLMFRWHFWILEWLGPDVTLSKANRQTDYWTKEDRGLKHGKVTG